jgi:hypothetical protein
VSLLLLVKDALYFVWIALLPVHTIRRGPVLGGLMCDILELDVHTGSVDLYQDVH